MVNIFNHLLSTKVGKKTIIPSYLLHVLSQISLTSQIFFSLMSFLCVICGRIST